MELTEEQKEIIEAIESKIIIDNQWYVPLIDWRKIHNLSVKLHKVYKGIEYAKINMGWIKTGNVNPTTKLPCKIKVYCVNDDNFDKFLEFVTPTANIIPIDYEENTWLSGIELNNIFNKCESWSYKTARRHNFKKNNAGQYKLSDFVELMKK